MCVSQELYDDLKAQFMQQQARHEQQMADLRAEFFRLIDIRDDNYNGRMRDLSDRIEVFESRKSNTGFPSDMAKVKRMYAQIWHTPTLTLKKKTAGHTPWSITIESFTDDNQKFRADFSLRDNQGLQALIKRNRVKTIVQDVPEGMLGGFTRRNDGQATGRAYCGSHYCLMDGHEAGISEVVVGLMAGGEEFLVRFEDFAPTNGGPGSSLWGASWHRKP